LHTKFTLLFNRRADLKPPFLIFRRFSTLRLQKVVFFLQRLCIRGINLGRSRITMFALSIYSCCVNTLHSTRRQCLTSAQTTIYTMPAYLLPTSILPQPSHYTHHRHDIQLTIVPTTALDFSTKLTRSPSCPPPQRARPASTKNSPTTCPTRTRTRTSLYLHV
jgi:hypothetical protein